MSGRFLVTVAQGFVRSDLVPKPLFDFFGLGKSPFGLAVPEEMVIGADFENPAVTWYQCDFTDLVRESGEQFLR